ncbi:hypothetical protein WS45_24960 [Burkholderia sp. RF2-non_BP3]|nr:hypothetical protein WS45_24960 [Burkholderia sp. RF2-non_BP3]
MNDYASSQRQTLKAAGFSPQDIDSYLGGQPAQPHPDASEANRSFAQAVGNSFVDSHNLINVGTGRDAMQTMKDIGTVYGPLEAALNVSTGMAFGFPTYIGAGAVGLFDKYVLGDKSMDPEAMAEKLSRAVTYQPHTEAGARLAGAAQYPLEVLNNAGMEAGYKVANVGERAGLSNTAASWAGAFTAAAIQMLPAALLGELGRKLNGQRITTEDMQNVAKVTAGPDAAPETVQSVENSLRATYQQTGIGPYTVLEQARIDPAIADELKSPDVSVPTAFQPYMRREQVGVPVSDQMKAVRPLEPETPIPEPVEPLESAPDVVAESPVLTPEVASPEAARTQAYETGDGDITLLHAGLSPIEAIQGLKDLGSRILQTDTGQAASAVMSDAVRDLQLKTTPMAAGSDRAMAIAKDAANAMRKAAWQWTAFDDLLRKGYTPEQRERMWTAAEEENTLRTQGVTDPARGLASLSEDERQTVDTLAQYGNALLDRARKIGMFQGEGVAYWTPRMVAMIGEDGEVSMPSHERVSSPEGRGGNITTSASALTRRKYATAEETEEAAKTKFGEGATVVRDIRTMPMAMSRIERAIAGRELVNRVKDVGLRIGQETVSSNEKPGYFTIDHPAFKTYRPRLIEQDGKMVPALDQDGNMMFDRVPLYVSKEFEGPLKAIMTEKSGALYKAFMGLKGKTMGLIMYSPLIHNAVEWGRALPMMPGKVLTGRVYFEGNAAKHDPVTMRRALDAGLVPIGHRFFNQDVTDLFEEPTIKPGRSLTAKAIGGAVGLLSDEAGTAVKAAIDKAGDVWHNTLLWDRVADLQMGLFTNLERDMIGKGLDPLTASRMAAHFANRYAGALPNEAMSAGARKLANVALFSRTFTLGNIGAMKDIARGLPGDVQAQILRDAGEIARAGAAKAARQKALHAFVMDVALMYVGNAIMQNAMDVIMRDKTVPQVLQGYAVRFKDYLSRADTDPSAILNIGSIFPNSRNEPGKEGRILFNTAKDGTAIYMRLPTGKIGEEFQGYLTSPLDMLKRKEGTILRPLMQAFQNDKGFGRKVYDDQEPGIKGMLHAVGNVVWNILQEQIPLDSIQSGYRLMSGHGDDVDALKTIGPLLGLTFSKGAPGGPQVGVMFEAEKRHQNEVASAMPGIRELIKDGDVQTAIQKMEEAHMTPQEQRMTLKYAINPQARLNRNRLKKFEQIAPVDMLERMEQLQQEQASSESSDE